MRDLIFIAHRIPYPPDKGEKIRGFNLLKHLSRSYRIHLGCLVDEPADMQHLSALREWCVDVAGFQIDKRRQKLKALATLRPGRPLMLDYYHHPGLQRWVRDSMARQHMDIVYIFTVAMAPYVEGLCRPGLILDAQDIDSEKWASYAGNAAWPMSAVWSREGRTLLAYERKAAMRCDHTLFVSQQECDRFLELAPETAGRVHVVEMGVDLDRFSPGQAFVSPFQTGGPHLVFTGNMDYWPNADAVQWFAADVFPVLRRRYPAIEFHVVGANPGRDVLRLAGTPGVSVTGRVPDTRPYMRHADACVVPLRIARGIQNKVLEAMAMGCPVVASPQAFEGVRAVAGQDLLVADGAVETADRIVGVLGGAYPGLRDAARAAMVRGYAWPAILSRLDAILESVPVTNLLGSAA
jgi:sugar transferase (PEP-CTERM/EpsH1 system associated)